MMPAATHSMAQASLLSLLWPLLLLPSLLLAMPLLLLCLQILAALPRRRMPPPPAGPRAALAVLVPAHDEAAGIAATLASIRGQLAPCDRLLVVADNCSDDTAGVARAAGASVVERHDEQHRGKAHALAHGLRHLAAAPPAIVICIDADCRLGPHALDWLAHRCAVTRRPAQALYLMHAGAGAAPTRTVAAFAWRLKNGLRALGRERLGMACQLSGSGMAFPWHALQTVTLDNNLVEDLALGLALAARGHAPTFCPEARVHSDFAGNADGARTQRTRWEHGHLHLLLRHAPRHLAASIARRDWRYASLAFDLCIPPLSMLLMLSALACAGPLLAWRFGGQAWPWLLPLLPSALTVITLLAAWLIAGRDLLPPRRLPAAVAYMLGKIPLYLRFVTRRQREWLGTARDADADRDRR